MITKRGSNPLLSEFTEVSKEKWIEKVNQDLKGADFTKKLVWKLPDGFSVDPFYMQEDMNSLEYLVDFHNLTLNQKDKKAGPRNWIYKEKIIVEDDNSSNREALAALKMGANGIEFKLDKGDISKLDSLISNIDPCANPVSFTNISNPLEFIDHYLDNIYKTGINPIDIKGSIDFDPLQALCLTGQLNTKHVDQLAKTIGLTKSIIGYRILTFNANHFLNSGASASQEIGYLLSVFVEYVELLTSRNIDIKDIVQNMVISVGVGTNFFQEIAKIRAIRVLFYHLLKSYSNQQFSPGNLFIHSDSSLWTKTIYDPYVNMLRNTTEAMAAVLGGCNSLSIAPFDQIYNKTNNFSSRVSRNISNLMKEESYFDKVADPVAGSYYIENLTDKLVESALDVFKEIESKGGFLKSFNAGFIQKSIAETRDKKHELISKRREVFIGTNQYPNIAESVNPADLKLTETIENKNILKTTRGAVQFENLRINTDKYVILHGEENRPKVYLSLIGDNKIMRKARASFSTGFFGCAGFKVIEGKVSESLSQSIDLAAQSNADIIVVCGADDDYLNSGITYATELKKRSKAILVIAGSPEDKKEELKDAGVIDFINLRTNLIDSLQNFQNLLKIVQV